MSLCLLEFGEIKVLEQNGEFWFVGKEIAKVLGFTNPRDAIKTHVFEEDKGVELIDTLGGSQKMTIINESGLYALVFGSRLPSAKKFKHWVTSEVLPSIRKQGKYEIPKTPMEALSLMFEVQKENTIKIDKLDEKMTNFEENAPLSPGEYNVISKKIHERVRNAKSEYGFINATKQQVAELYRAINNDVKEATGVYTRAQLRKKDFENVMELIREWIPSKALVMKLEQMNEA